MAILRSAGAQMTGHANLRSEGSFAEWTRTGGGSWVGHDPTTTVWVGRLPYYRNTTKHVNNASKIYAL